MKDLIKCIVQALVDNPEQVAIDLKMIPGVVETGLFIGMTDEVHVGTEVGSYILKK